MEKNTDNKLTIIQNHLKTFSIFLKVIAKILPLICMAISMICYRVILGVKQSSSVAKPPCFDSILVRALPLGLPNSTGLLP